MSCIPNQLGLGQIYPPERTKAGLGKIHETNRFTDVEGVYAARFRDFLGKGDTGWRMFVHPGAVPGNTILYDNEVRLLMRNFFALGAWFCKFDCLSTLEAIHHLTGGASQPPP